MLTNDPIIHKKLTSENKFKISVPFFIIKMGSQVEFKYKPNNDTTFVLGKPTETHPQIPR